tara:strand:+ start:658 stop:2163 length:1506 start_codon:yes stop_codon:yes gene_type:complete
MPSTQNVLKFSHGGELSAAKARKGKAHHRPGLDWLIPVSEVNQVNAPTHDALLVGPSDQFQIGEMLKPHVLTRLLSFSRFRCAGPLGADQTSMGGHAVRNYGESALEMGGRNLQLLHFGSQSIDQSLNEGYARAIEGEEAERFESLSIISGEEELRSYVRRRTGQLDDFAYVMAPEGEFYGAQSSFHAVGLSQPESLSEAKKSRLLDLMRQSAFVGVSDENGANFLESEGIDVHRMPCALSVLPHVCARQLREHRDGDHLEEIRHRFPNGWIAVEVGEVRDADFDRLTEALREISDRDGLGLVFFDAQNRGESNVRRWVDAFAEWNAASYSSDNIWDVAAMLLHSRLYCGSSLDCRVISMSGGVARLNVPTGTPAARSYCELWEHDSVPIEFSDTEDWSIALDEALTVDLAILQGHATDLHRKYFSAFEKYCKYTGMVPRLLPEAVATPHRRVAEDLHHLRDEWLADEKSLQLFRQLNRNSAKRSVAEQIRQKLGLRKIHA